MKHSESRRKLKDLVLVCARRAAKNDTLVLQESDKEYIYWTNNILFFEEILLECIGFNINFDLVHVVAIQILERRDGILY